MKVTVYRQQTAAGYGPPAAFLGDDKPEQAGWFVNASAEIPDADGGFPRRLHTLGRAFLVYSMYHAREPRYLAYAVENMGAAARKLGYTLPLTEDHAAWLTYPREGLDPGSPEDRRELFRQIALVFGPRAATEQARALGMEWPVMATRTPDNGRAR